MKKLLPLSLTRILESAPKLAIAYSGGLDSRFLCHAALLCGCEVLALHAVGPHIANAETEFARQWANGRGIAYEETHFNPLECKEIAHNTLNRCYACKKSLFQALKTRISACNSGFALCDGANFSDLALYRPGSKAAAEAGVLSPLAQAGLSKMEIRTLAAHTGLSWPDQKSRPCLLTRFSYDLPIDLASLRIIEDIENLIDNLLYMERPETDFRLRFTPEPVLHLTYLDKRLENELKALLDRQHMAHCRIEVLERLSGYFDKS